MLIHTQLLIISLNFSNAFLLRSSSENPTTLPQKPFMDRCACFDRALAPTVSLGWLLLSIICFALSTVNLLLKLSDTYVSGGGHTSFDPTVFLMPMQVKNPRGVKATKKFLISRKRTCGSAISSASKTSSRSEVSLHKVSSSKFVSSWSRPGSFLNLIEKMPSFLQRTSTIQKSFMRFPLGYPLK